MIFLFNSLKIQNGRQYFSIIPLVWNKSGISQLSQLG